MGLRGVPWGIGNPGARIPASAARDLAYLITGDVSGVAGAGDMAVLPMFSPGAGVRIMPGIAGTVSKTDPLQAYISHNDSIYDHLLTAQGSSGVRHDLIALVVEDSYYEGVPAPADVAMGPYERFRTYTNVGSGVMELSEVDPSATGQALARVKFDANDSIVQLADITDLRKLSKPKTQVIKKVINRPAAANEAVGVNLDTFPTGASWVIEVPAWAGEVVLEQLISGIRAVDTGTGGGNANGTNRVVIGTIVTPSAEWRFDAVAASKQTAEMVSAAGVMPVPKAYRGTFRTLQSQMARSAQAGMTVQAAWGTNVIVTATFTEVPDRSVWL